MLSSQKENWKKALRFFLKGRLSHKQSINYHKITFSENAQEVTNSGQGKSGNNSDCSLKLEHLLELILM